ncbi:phage terminase small subunit [Desulfovibrio cuneatus]|uniref:phage terminase small subunit n=1 Tax=Desulfovibrio cuneatus TaxID=159728 RepID=UPI000422A4C0|nr:phage terminase small subunit [Desulfovibrio cuneatus]
MGAPCGLGPLRRQQLAAAQVVAAMPAPIAPAAVSAEGVSPTSPMQNAQLNAFLHASLTTDLAMLKEHPSMERKITIKRETLLPKYAEYVQRLQEAGMQHDLIGYYLVWLFDAGDVGKGLELAMWCLGHGQNLPERFNSTVPFFTASAVATWAEAEQTAGRTVNPYAQMVLDAISATENPWPVPDSVTSRFYRVLGLQAETAGNLQEAFDLLHRAFELGAQVKTAFTRVEKALAKQQAEAPSAQTP